MAKARRKVTEKVKDNPVVSLLQAMGYDTNAPMHMILSDMLQSQTVKKEVRATVAREAAEIATQMLKTPEWAEKIRQLVEIELDKLLAEIGQKVARAIEWRYG